MFSFESLIVYKKGLEFAFKVYDITDSWPKDEVFGLTSQFRRAAVSISLNIAEGSGRTKKDFRHFLDMSRTSCHECIPLIEIAKKRSYIDSKNFKLLYEELEVLAKLISGLKRSLAT